jgi:rhomboid protease GluP
MPQGQPQQAGAPQSVRVALPSTVPYLTYSIIGLTVLVFLLQIISAWLFGYFQSDLNHDLPSVLTGYIAGNRPIDWLEVYGAQISQFIVQGQLWRLLTPMLLHASVIHIGLNMYVLFAFGVGLERSFGHGRFLALYLLGGFAGNVLSFLFTAGPSIGASTALFGLFSAEGVFLYQNRKILGKRARGAIYNIVFWVVVNLFFIGSFVPNIDRWGHIGGLIGGLIFAWFAGPIWEVQGVMPNFHVVDQREPRSVMTGAALVVLVFGALALWGIVAPMVH